jgi:hypothetical protein
MPSLRPQSIDIVFDHHLCRPAVEWLYLDGRGAPFQRQARGIGVEQTQTWRQGRGVGMANPDADDLGDQQERA